MTAYVVGVGSTAFRKWPERSFRDLAGEAFDAVLVDAGLAHGRGIEHVAFGNCAMGLAGQRCVRGQVVLAPQQREGRLAHNVPIVNLEGGCATGSLALHGAFNAIMAGADLALAFGVEKTWFPEEPARSFALFSDGIDQLHPEEWRSLFEATGKDTGCGWEPDSRRVMFLDVHALQAREHMQRYGTTARQIALIASRNHAHGARNPKAQFRLEMAPETVLVDKKVVPPLTRSMCAPISDGAAAVLVASKRWLARQSASTRERALRVRACALAGGRPGRAIDEPSVTHHAAERAYALAGLGPAQIEVAEVHDATSSCQILHCEALGFCPPGEGGAYASSDAVAQNGPQPMNLSGGLISKGHPLAATGLGMIDELAQQLRGEAGERQATREPAIGLAHNAGGLVSFDEALCGVTILERG